MLTREARGGAARQVPYQALAQAAAGARLCAVVPAVRDAFWRAVSFGLAVESQRLDAALVVRGAGRHASTAAQRDAFSACLDAAPDAVLLAPLDTGGLAALVGRAREAGVAVVSLINDPGDLPVDASVVASEYRLGRLVGARLASDLRRRSGPDGEAVLVATGPAGAPWADALQAGVIAGLGEAKVSLVVRRYRANVTADTSLELLRSALQEHPGLATVVGHPKLHTVALEQLRLATGGELRLFGLSLGAMSRSRIGRGEVVAAPSSEPALQGRIAVDLAVRAARGRLATAHVEVPGVLIDNASFARYDWSRSSAPAGHRAAAGALGTAWLP